MGALFFNYSVFPEPKTSTKFFEYRWDFPLTEYRFEYERYAALSDASIFKAPVAVTKVATGVRLYDLFVERNDRDSAYFQRPIGTNLAYYSREPKYHQDLFISRPLPVVPREMERINFLYDKHTSYENGRFRVDRINDDNVIEMLRETCVVPDKTILENNAFFVPPIIRHKNVVELSMEAIPYRDKIVNWEQHETINRPFPYMTININDFNETHRNDDHILQQNDYHEITNTEKPASMELHLKVVAKRTEPGWQLYKDEFAVRIKNDLFKILEDEFAWVYDYRTVNYVKHFTLNRDRWGMWIHDDDIAAPTRRDMNIVGLHILGTPERRDIIFDSTFLGGAIDGKDSNILAPGLQGQFNKDGNIVTSGISGLRDTYQTNFYENVLLSKEFYKLHVFERTLGGSRGTQGYLGLIFDPNNYFGFPKEKILSYFQSAQAYAINEKGYIQDYTPSGKAKVEGGAISENLSGFLDRKKSFVDNGFVGAEAGIESTKTAVFKEISGADKVDLFVSSDNGYGVQKRIFPSYTLDLASFAVQEDKYAIILDGINVASKPKDVFGNNGVWTSNDAKHVSITQKDLGGWKDIHQAVVDDLPAFGFKDGMELSAIGFNLHGKKNDKKAFEQSIVSGKQGNKKGITQDSVFAKNDRKSLADLEKPTTASKSRQGFTIYDSISVKLGKKPIDLETNNGIQTYHKKKSFIISDLFTAITKKRHGITIWPDQNLISKVRHSFEISDSGTLIQKVRHGFVIDDFQTCIYKDRKSISMELAILWACHKSRHSMILPEWGFGIYKDRKDLFLDNAIEGAYKKRHSIEMIADIEGAFKTLYPVAVSHYLKYPNWEKLGGFIVPVSKLRHQAMIDYVNEFVKKHFRDVMITEGDFGSVIARPGMLNVDVSLDKIPKKAFLDYMNEMLVKDRLKATIEEGVFGFKAPHNVQIEYEEPWAYVAPKKVHINYNDLENWTSKENKRVMETEEVWTSKASVNAQVFADEWLDKSPNLCYYSYDVWGWKKKGNAFLDPGYMAGQGPKEVQVEQQLFGEKPELKAMLQFGSFGDRGINQAWYEEGVFTDRLIKTSDIFQQLEWGFKAAHKCDLPPNDFGNWAWIYETPDPFQYDKYGIDELLLPEKDTRYENFEDLVFDREHMRPRNAIKEISDTEWIARLPIRHPVKNHSDVGRVYEDSAIKWENYFGIQSSVIHDMFLRYYRIWEKNMFKFSTMTMQQAGNLMLEYIWSWIPDYFPIDQIEQAYRAFQLIRWYTECAIINNSQYIISYKYADLRWPRVDKEGNIVTELCRIPSDLQEYDPTNIVDNSNDTMFTVVDGKIGYLKINPIYYGSNDTWVTFRIKNKRNTTISFDLYNEVGAVNMYLNGRLIESLTAHGSHKLAYNIRYTGDTNEFKIEKKAKDTDEKFVLGNICVGMQDFDDLDIRFDPALRAGNKPLNEVAQKLIQFAALHDRKDIAYHEMLTKNLGVSEVYKMLCKYWDLHHENKWKGKRLTIKQV